MPKCSSCRKELRGSFKVQYYDSYQVDLNIRQAYYFSVEPGTARLYCRGCFLQKVGEYRVVGEGEEAEKKYRKIERHLQRKIYDLERQLKYRGRQYENLSRKYNQLREAHDKTLEEFHSGKCTQFKFVTAVLNQQNLPVDQRMQPVATPIHRLQQILFMNDRIQDELDDVKGAQLPSVEQAIEQLSEVLSNSVKETIEKYEIKVFQAVKANISKFERRKHELMRLCHKTRIALEGTSCSLNDHLGIFFNQIEHCQQFLSKWQDILHSLKAPTS